MEDQTYKTRFFVKISVEKIDKRVIARYVSAGLIKKAELDAYLSSLPDLTNECVNILDVIVDESTHVSTKES